MILQAPFDMNGDGPFKYEISAIYDYKIKESELARICSNAKCKSEFKYGVINTLKYEEKYDENAKKFLEFLKDKECGLLAADNDNFFGYFYCLTNKSWYEFNSTLKNTFTYRKISFDDILKESKYYSENISSEKRNEDTEKEAKRIKQSVLTAASKFHLEEPSYNIIDKFRLFDKPANLKHNMKFIGYYKNSDNTKKFIEWVNKLCDKNKLVELYTKTFSGGKNIAIYITPLTYAYIKNESGDTIMNKEDFEVLLEAVYNEGYEQAELDVMNEDSKHSRTHTLNNIDKSALKMYDLGYKGETNDEKYRQHLIRQGKTLNQVSAKGKQRLRCLLADPTPEQEKNDIKLSLGNYKNM